MQNQKNDNFSDEIDLGQFFSKIGSFFKSIGLGVIHFLALLRRVPLENMLTFSLVISASVVIGIAYSNLISKKFYESTMILSSNYFNKRLVDNTIEKLNLLATEKNKKGLSRVLDIPDTLADNILEFSARPFVAEADVIELEVLKEQLKNAQADAKNEKVIEQVISRIEIENRHAFEITVRTLNPTVVGNLQVALVSFFRNNEYIKKRIEINKTISLERKEKLNRDLQRLDSLKFVIFDNYRNMAAQTRQGSNNVILSDKAVTDPVQIYKQYIDLYNELQFVDSEIYLQRDFEVIDGFTEFSEPTSAGTLRIVVISILIGVLVSYILIALATLNKYLANVT